MGRPTDLKNQRAVYYMRGRKARERALNRAKGGRISAQDWWPEVELMLEQQMNQEEIAWALKLTTRRVRQIIEWGHNSLEGEGQFRFIPEVVQAAESDDPMFEFAGRGFKLFYERFSGQTLPPHCEDWVQFFCDARNLMINIPPRHMKSEIFAVWVPCWLVARNRDEQIIIVSETAALAQKHARKINDILTNGTVVEALGPFKPDKQGETPWRVGDGEMTVVGRKRPIRPGDFTFQSRGSGQQILGFEASVVICDDVTTRPIAESETQREKQIAWLQGEVFSRIEVEAEGTASGRACVVGQRVHFRDCYGYFEGQTYQRGPKKGQQLWTVIKQPAIIRWPDEDPERPEPLVLWPEKWTFDELMVTYERIGGHAIFECMYQQVPLPADAALVKPEWWERCRDYKRAGYHGLKPEEDEDQFVPVVRVLSIDPSPKRYHGLVVADLAYNRDQFVAGIVEAKHFVGNLRMLIEEITRCVNNYAPDYFVFEQSTFSSWLYEDPFFMRIKDRVRVIGHNTGRNKADPELGVESLGGDIEFGRISLPYGDMPGREMSQLLEDEANVWPFGDHDDILMALWFIKFNYKRLVPLGALPTSFRRGSAGGWSFNEDLTRVRDRDKIKKMMRGLRRGR